MCLRRYVIRLSVHHVLYVCTSVCPFTFTIVCFMDGDAGFCTFAVKNWGKVNRCILFFTLLQQVYFVLYASFTVFTYGLTFLL